MEKGVASMGLGIFIVRSVPLRVPILYQLADLGYFVAALASGCSLLFFLRFPAHMKPKALAVENLDSAE